MGWPKGMPRPEGAGRKKGTLNKDTRDLFAICEKHNLNPFEAMVKIAIEESNRDKKFDKLKEISQYLYPKRKAVEHSGEVNQRLIEEAKKIQDLPEDELRKIIKEEIGE